MLRGRRGREGGVSRQALVAGCCTLTVLALLGSSSRLAAQLAWLHAGRVGTQSPPWRAVVAQPLAPLPPLSEGSCNALAEEWVTGAQAAWALRAAQPALNLTFFLHVPRTAGRSLFFCALKPAFAPSERCPRSYDQLRLELGPDAGAPHCALLSSHDDHRLLAALPGRARVVTQLRRPLDRLLSAYEFTVEVASRTAFTAKRPNPSRAPERTDTTQVWPWSVLVPLLRTDMHARWVARGRRAPPRPPPGDDQQGGYSSPFVLSLLQFVEHPAVRDVLHNGASYQLLGVTNNTARSGDAPADARHARTAQRLRLCAREAPMAARAMQAMAAQRLRQEVAVVSLKERLDGSVALLAATLERPLSGGAYRSGGDAKEAQQRAALERNPAAQQALDRGERDGSPGALARAYRHCEKRQRERMAARRGRALERLRYDDGSQLSFDRARVPAAVRAAVERENALDVALYQLGSQLFQEREAALRSAGRWESLDDVT